MFLRERSWLCWVWKDQNQSQSAVGLSLRFDHVLTSEFCLLYMFHTFLNEIMAEAKRIRSRANKSTLTYFNANVNTIFHQKLKIWDKYYI